MTPLCCLPLSTSLLRIKRVRRKRNPNLYLLKDLLRRHLSLTLREKTQCANKLESFLWIFVLPTLLYISVFLFFPLPFAHPLTDMDFFFFFGGGLLGSRFYYAFFNTLHDATNTVLAVLTGFRNPKNVLMCRVVSMRRVSSGFCQCSPITPLLVRAKKTKVRVWRPNFIWTKNIPLRRLSGPISLDWR